MANLPVSAQLKLRRAREHRKALESEIVTWAASKSYEYFTREVEDSDPDFQRIQYVVKVKKPLPGDRLGQILGDCLETYGSTQSTTFVTRYLYAATPLLSDRLGDHEVNRNTTFAEPCAGLAGGRMGLLAIRLAVN
jgi:hypothetical protein